MFACQGRRAAVAVKIIANRRGEARRRVEIPLGNELRNRRHQRIVELPRDRFCDPARHDVMFSHHQVRAVLLAPQRST